MRRPTEWLMWLLLFSPFSFLSFSLSLSLSLPEPRCYDACDKGSISTSRRESNITTKRMWFSYVRVSECERCNSTTGKSQAMCNTCTAGKWNIHYEFLLLSLSLSLDLSPFFSSLLHLNWTFTYSACVLSFILFCVWTYFALCGCIFTGFSFLCVTLRGIHAPRARTHKVYSRVCVCVCVWEREREKRNITSSCPTFYVTQKLR